MISIIAAIGKNRELGKDNKLLWHIPEDLKRFKELTSGHVVIMGRKTYESIGKPLPNRINIIVTRDNDYHQKDTIVCHSLEEALRQAQGKPSKEVFIIGGGEIYKQGLEYADKLYLTLIDKEYPEADAFFPDYSEFKRILSEENHEENGIFFKFIDLAR